MSKFSLDVLEKCVYPFVKTDDPHVLLGAAFGEDVALTKVGGDILASHVDPIIGAINNIGWLAVHVACNDIAASGIPPRWILLLILVPGSEDHDLLANIMMDINRATQETGVSIIGGHTGYSAGISRPLVAVTALGTASGCQPVRTGGANIGDYVLVTKGIGLEGTSILAHDFSDIGRKLGLKEQDMEEARLLIEEVSVVKEALLLAEQGATSMHDVTRGGLLETLLEMAYLSKVCIKIDTSLLPIRKIVNRFSKAFKFDPLRMISSGTIAATIPASRKRDVSKSLSEAGIAFAIIGRVTIGEGVCVVRGSKNIRYTEIKCEEDELARMWKLYPRNI